MANMVTLFRLKYLTAANGALPSQPFLLNFATALQKLAKRR